MQNYSSVQILFPIAPEEFLGLIRIIVKEELEKHSLRQPVVNFKVAGLTYKPLYKMDEICEIFEVTPPTIYDWIKHGKLKPKKIRARVYFLWDDIVDLLQTKRQ